MTQPHVHLGYAPRGAGLLFAVLWFGDGNDVYGWFIGGVDGEYRAAFFKLEDYYAAKGVRLLWSAQDDVYGPWLEATPHEGVAAPLPTPVPEPLCHELVRLQDRFIRHWLFFANDPDGAAQAAGLAARELAVRAVNIRADRLGKFRNGAAVWRYDAPGADTGVLIDLSRRWPLDYRVEP